MTDSSDYDGANFVINAQPYGFVPVPHSSGSTGLNASEDGGDGYSFSFETRQFTTGEFIELLDALKVPFLEKSGNTSGPPDLLGAGGFAQIKYDEVTNQDGSNKMVVALKEFKNNHGPISHNLEKVSRIEAVSPATITQAFKEVCIMKHPQLSMHPNILQLLGTTDYLGIQQSAAWDRFCLITEYASLGSLGWYLRQHCCEQDRFPWDVKAQLISDIAAGLDALHSCDIIHNDIKCDNVLLFPVSSPTEEKIVAKISDFGCAVLLAETQPKRTRAATEYFAAPEACSQQCIVHSSRDTYALGLVVLQIITGRDPFVGVAGDVREYKTSPKFLEHVHERFDSFFPSTPKMKEFAASLLAVDPAQRPCELSCLTSLLKAPTYPLHTISH
jgi:serine/threonine protein kinase